MNNPYNKRKQEQLYLAFEHGMNAPNKDDNPYTQDDGEVFSAWMRGFNLSKKDKKTVKSEEELKLEAVDLKGKEPDTIPKVTTYIGTISTKALLEELKSRKAIELKELMKQREELDKKINNIAALFEI